MTEGQRERERERLTNSWKGDEALDNHLGLGAPGPGSLEETVQSHSNGAGCSHRCHIALHKPPSWDWLRGSKVVKWEVRA